uniref:Ovule protein n=1 Tax=Mesocestoides corti TaxID=53468 RepID=A0A5K3G699_MESCO
MIGRRPDPTLHILELLRLTPAIRTFSNPPPHSHYHSTPNCTPPFPQYEICFNHDIGYNTTFSKITPPTSDLNVICRLHDTPHPSLPLVSSAS